MDLEETLPALLDERSVMSCTVLGIILDGVPMEGAPVPDVAPVWGDCSLIGMAVSDPLEHSGLGVTVHEDMDSLRMAPWDAGGTLRRTYRHGMAVWRDVLCCVV